MESERRRQRGNLEQGTLINRPWPRRKVLQVISALGVGSAIFGRALVALAEEKAKITEAMVRQAEWFRAWSSPTRSARSCSKA